MKGFLIFLAVLFITLGLIIGAYALLPTMGGPDYGRWAVAVILGGGFGWMGLIAFGMLIRQIYRLIHYSRLGIPDPEVEIYWEAKSYRKRL